jgi:hypothetical protein
MATSAQDLNAIRRLSQYRPFERGGDSERERKEDLIVAGLAEAGGTCSSLGDCASTLNTLWGLTYEELELTPAIKHLLEEGRVARDQSGGYSLTGPENTRLEAAAAASRALAKEALDHWHVAVARQWPAISEADLQTLDAVLERFIHAIVQQHGAESALLVYPDDPAAQSILESPDAKAQALAPCASPEESTRAEWALSMFMREGTDAQRAYLSETLNATYFVTALTLDSEGARLIQAITSGQRVYLDTNFVYRLLGVQGPRYVRAAEGILRATQAAGYVCAVTPWTVAEYRKSLARSKQFLERYPVPPDAFASSAADATSVDDFVTSYWRQAKDTHLSVTDLVAFHEEVEAHLQARGIAVVDEGTRAIDAQTDKIDAEAVVLTRVLGEKWRHPDLITHDVKHRLLVKRLRGDANRSFANAGYWFLTLDRVLPRYDQRSEQTEPGGRPRVPFCVSAGAWFQVVAAFRPKTKDFDQTLADVIASPYIHPRTGITKEAAQAVVARVALYTGGTPELAAHVFMNSAAMAEIERKQDTQEQADAIDSAIVAAAKALQEEALLAREEAAREQERAAKLAAEAAEWVASSEREKEAAITTAQIEAREAIAGEQARAREASKNDEARWRQENQATEARSEERLEQERQVLQKELQRKDEEITTERRRADTLRRRQRLVVITLVLAAVFVLVGLAAGLSTAWAYVVAVGVLLGLVVAGDQLLERLKR